MHSTFENQWNALKRCIERISDSCSVTSAVTISEKINGIMKANVNSLKILANYTHSRQAKKKRKEKKKDK